MATLYYYSIGGNDLNDASLWWNDLNHTSPAGRIPTSSDNVVILSDVTNTATSPTYNSIQVKSAIFGNSNGGNTLTIATSAVFYGLCINYFSITVLTTYFNGYSINRGTINGNVIFNDCSYNGSGGKYTTATFNSINNKTIGNASLVL